jgi:hypothetical protein
MWFANGYVNVALVQAARRSSGYGLIAHSTL